MRTDVALACISLGVLVVVGSCVGARRAAADPLVLLHFVTPITSVGAPLVELGLVVQHGVGLTSAVVVACVVLLALGAPALQTATARCIAEHEGLVEGDSPE